MGREGNERHVITACRRLPTPHLRPIVAGWLSDVPKADAMRVPARHTAGYTYGGGRMCTAAVGTFRFVHWERSCRIHVFFSELVGSDQQNR